MFLSRVRQGVAGFALSQRVKARITVLHCKVRPVTLAHGSTSTRVRGEHESRESVRVSPNYQG